MMLYSYWRSTTSYRVRIGLNLKGLDYSTTPVDLVAGAQSSPDYLRLNPGKGVPTLVLDDGSVLTQSMAILEWLDQTHPEPRLIPADAAKAAQVRAAALTIACDIHPVNNLKVVNRIKDMGHTGAEAVAWMAHWMQSGFDAYQALLPADTAFSFGESPDLADICLIPQLYNARRWEIDLEPYKRLTDIEARCLALQPFADAHPDNQPDAP